MTIPKEPASPDPIRTRQSTSTRSKRARASEESRCAKRASFQCRFCGRIKSACTEPRDSIVRIRCACGGQQADGVARMHSRWSRNYSEDFNVQSFGQDNHAQDDDHVGLYLLTASSSEERLVSRESVVDNKPPSPLNDELMLSSTVSCVSHGQSETSQAGEQPAAWKDLWMFLEGGLEFEELNQESPYARNYLSPVTKHSVAEIDSDASLIDIQLGIVTSDDLKHIAAHNL